MTALEKQIMDKLDETLLVVRQSTPESLSPILNELRNKIDTCLTKIDSYIVTNEDNIKEIRETLKAQDVKMEALTNNVKPAVDAIDTANNLKRGVAWIAGIILSVVVVKASLGDFLKWLSEKHT